MGGMLSAAGTIVLSHESAASMYRDPAVAGYLTGTTITP
jgi:hypothetical protein